MTAYLILATSTGVVVCQQEGGDWHELRRGLDGRRATSVIAREGVILAGTEQGIFRSEDLGQTWSPASQGLDEPYVRWLGFHPDISDFEYAGTEPASIFISRDGGASWRERGEVAELRDQLGWYLPYSPQAGCVRGFAVHGSRAYAAVEVGGVLVSDDRGESWRLVQGSTGKPHENVAKGWVHPDVHSIVVHPTTSDLVCAPTGGGFFLSKDGGAFWENLYSRCYCRAVWWDPDDQDHLVLGPADGVDYNGRIEETRDGGRTWSPASGGLDTPWRTTMVERFFPVGVQLLAMRSDGVLLSSARDHLQWQQILPGAPGVESVAHMEI